MIEFNVVEVGMDPVQVEHGLVLQNIRRMEQQSARLRSRARSTLGAGKSAPALTSRSGARAPAKAEPAAPARGHVEAIALEDRCKAEWSQSAELRSEFSSFEQYLAYAKAAEQGRARIFGQAEGGSGPRREPAAGEVSPEEARAAAIIERWKKSPELRAEFRGDLCRFAAYEAARARGATPARE